MSTLSKPRNGIEFLDQVRGRNLRLRADRKTAFRSNFSPFLGASLAADKGKHKTHTIFNTAFTALMEWTDKTDGDDAREAARLLNEPTTVEGGEADHRADKTKYYSQTLGLAFRSIVHEQNYKQGGFFIINGVIQAVRDRRMQDIRETAKEQEIEAKARDLGKYKTVMNGIGNGLHTLAPAIPEQYRPHVQRAGNIALGAGTALSLVALADMQLHVDRHTEVAEVVELRACPDFVQNLG